VHNGWVPENGHWHTDRGQPSRPEDLDLDRLAVESIVSELDTAHEELRVAEEEVQAQQEEIDRLLGFHQSDQWWQQFLIGNLPVPVLVTDRAGHAVSANAAARELLGMRQGGLVGMPVHTFVAAADQRALRQALRHTLVECRGRSFGCEVQPRDAPAQHVELVVSRGPDAGADDPRLTWIMLPRAEAAPTGGRDRNIAEGLSRLAVLASQPDRSQYLSEVARICGEVIAPAAAISVTVGHPVDPTTVVSDSELAQGMDALQIRAGEGPGEQAWEQGTVVVTNRLEDDSRWPELTRLAAPEGVASVLAVPVCAGEERVGVINAYATEPDVFASLDVHSAGLLATAVAAVISQVQERERLTNLAGQLEQALTSRAAIDQAKGIIMARYGCTADEAFQRLVRVSRTQNIKLRDVARVLVEQTQQPHNRLQNRSTGGR
jgi:PAS domain S-box-containing protein